jgi:hypothetical protein
VLKKLSPDARSPHTAKRSVQLPQSCDGRSCMPRHSTRAFGLTKQVCGPPAATLVNVPAGGLAWPYWLSPQQASVPSVFTPHV